MTPSSTVSVITFPHDDPAFRAHVEAAQAQLGHWNGESVEQEVRKAYPRALIRQADPLARLDPMRESWYAYRDGTATARQYLDEWWLDPALPRTVLLATGQYIEANDAAVDLFGVPRTSIVAGHAGDFTRHEGNPDVERRLFAALDTHGYLHSTAVVVRPDGEEWPIEFRTWAVREAGQYVTVMRRIEW